MLGSHGIDAQMAVCSTQCLAGMRLNALRALSKLPSILAGETRMRWLAADSEH